MLYFNRNGVWFTIPIAKNAVYDRELLEKQIHTSLLGLQNLKDRSPGIDQMRFEKPGEYKIKSVFGRDDIIINPSILKPLKKNPTEKEEILPFPIPVINIFDGNYINIAWDVSNNFLSQVCPYIKRFNFKNSDEFKIVLPIQDGDDSHLFLIEELELVTDDTMLQRVVSDSDYDTDGYVPAAPVVWPDWWSCGFCGGSYSECAPDDIGVTGAYHYVYPLAPPDTFYEFGSFYGGAPDYAPKCSEDAMNAFWWNHYSKCATSNIIRTQVGVGSVIGANSWTSQESIISIDLYYWLTEHTSFYAQNAGTVLREWHEGDTCHYSSWGNKMDPGNALSSTSASTASTITYPSLIDGAIWSQESKHIYLWYNQDISGSYSYTENANDISLFITGDPDPSYYPDDIIATTPTVFYVTTDEGDDYEITSLPDGSNIDFGGHTDIYNYNGSPVYMFSFYAAYYNSSTFNIEYQNIWYGFIYDGRMHMLKFEATDYMEHLFETATYISPDEIETVITFSDDYAGLTGDATFLGGKFMSITNSILQGQGEV